MASAGDTEATQSDPLVFDVGTISALQKWLPLEQIEGLRYVMEKGRHQLKKETGAPSLGKQRVFLKSVAGLAGSLGGLLNRPPPQAKAELNSLFQIHFGGFSQRKATVAHLEDLAKTIEQRLANFPTQSRRKSQVFLVSQIARILVASDIKPSASVNSRFFKICAILFNTIGVYQSPAAAIRAFMQQ